MYRMKWGYKVEDASKSVIKRLHGMGFALLIFQEYALYYDEAFTLHLLICLLPIEAIIVASR